MTRRKRKPRKQSHILSRWQKAAIVAEVKANPTRTYEAVGAPYGITRQRVQQIVKAAGVKRERYQQIVEETQNGPVSN